MPEVKREEIIDFVTYSEQRDSIRPEIIAKKELRRIHVGEYLTFLFENHDTIWYQIQEMTRAEQIVKEAEIKHEIETYNEIVTANGSLGCSLLIEIDDVEVRQEKLAKWLKLPENIYVILDDGSQIPAQYDKRQIGHDRLSSVQYLRFNVNGKTPVAIGIDLPDLKDDFPAETKLSDNQKKALEQDLKD